MKKRKAKRKKKAKPPENRERGRCGICIERFSYPKKLPCGHTFHLKCILKWVEINSTCPECRGKVIHLRHSQTGLCKEMHYYWGHSETKVRSYIGDFCFHNVKNLLRNTLPCYWENAPDNDEIYVPVYKLKTRRKWILISQYLRQIILLKKIHMDKIFYEIDVNGLKRYCTTQRFSKQLNKEHFNIIVSWITEVFHFWCDYLKIRYYKSINNICVDLAMRTIRDKKLSAEKYQTAIISAMYNVMKIYFPFTLEQNIITKDYLLELTNWSSKLKTFEDLRGWQISNIIEPEITV